MLEAVVGPGEGNLGGGRGEKKEKGEVTRGGGKGEGPEGACKRRDMVEGSRERKEEGSGEGLVDG